MAGRESPPLARASPASPANSHPGWDRLGADAIGIGGPWSRSPAPHTPPCEENPFIGARHRPERSEGSSGARKIMSPTGSLDYKRRVARSDERHHARDSASERAEHLLWAMAEEKGRCFRASNRRPLPIMASPPAPEARPLA